MAPKKKKEEKKLPSVQPTGMLGEALKTKTLPSVQPGGMLGRALSTQPKEKEIPKGSEVGYEGSYSIKPSEKMSKEDYRTLTIGNQVYHLTKAEYDSYINPISIEGQTDKLREIYKLLSYVKSPEYKQDIYSEQVQPYVEGLAGGIEDLGAIRPERMDEQFLAELGTRAITGTGTGAGIGALAGKTAGAGFAGGPVIGATLGTIQSLISAARAVDVEETANAYSSFKNSKKIISSLVNAANKGMSPYDVMTTYNEELRRIAIAKANLKYLTRNAGIEALSGARKELQDIEDYERQLNSLIYPALVQAMNKPNPNAVDVGGLFQENE